MLSIVTATPIVADCWSSTADLRQPGAIGTGGQGRRVSLPVAHEDAIRAGLPTEAGQKRARRLGVVGKRWQVVILPTRDGGGTSWSAPSG